MFEWKKKPLPIHQTSFSFFFFYQTFQSYDISFCRQRFRWKVWPVYLAVRTICVIDNLWNRFYRSRNTWLRTHDIRKISYDFLLFISPILFTVGRGACVWVDRMFSFFLSSLFVISFRFISIWLTYLAFVFARCVSVFISVVFVRWIAEMG